MTKWSSVLAQDTISAHLIEELAQHLCSGDHACAFRTLRSPAQNKRDVASKKRLVKKLGPSIPSHLANAILEELAEISEDIGWKKSPRGKYLITLNDWLQPLHSQIREDSRFDNIVVGGHSKHEVIFVTGKVTLQADLDELIEFLSKNNPPYKIMVKLV